MTKSFRIVCALVVALAAFVAPRSAHAERIRDLADVAGARENQLVGYGLVTGLAGTGDDTSVPFTSQSVLSMLRRLGVQVDSPQVRLRNVAAVIVTTSLPAFAKPGTKIDVTVSSMGDAKSLADQFDVALTTPAQRSTAGLQVTGDGGQALNERCFAADIRGAVSGHCYS